jgi:hypothetical protein
MNAVVGCPFCGVEKRGHALRCHIQACSSRNKKTGGKDALGMVGTGGQMRTLRDLVIEDNTPEESWARVELWRWQYGHLPAANDEQPLDVAAGLRGMAEAIRKGDLSNFPTPFNVIAVLEYAAKVISANAASEGRP